jgi:hypothetical protein
MAMVYPRARHEAGPRSRHQGPACCLFDVIPSGSDDLNRRLERWTALNHPNVSEPIYDVGFYDRAPPYSVRRCRTALEKGRGLARATAKGPVGYNAEQLQIVQQFASGLAATHAKRNCPS